MELTWTPSTVLLKFDPAGVLIERTVYSPARALDNNKGPEAFSD